MVRFFRIGCFPTPTRLSERFYEKKVQYLLFRIARRNTGWALENNLFGKIAPYRELCGIRSSPVSEAFIVLEHVTWWPTPWEPFHHSLELANEIAWLVALKMDP